MYGKQNQNVRVNFKTGNEEILKTLYEVVDKKSGQIITNVFKGYFEIGGKLFQVTVSPRLKETKQGGNAVWCKIVKLQNNNGSGNRQQNQPKTF